MSHGSVAACYAPTAAATTGLIGSSPTVTTGKDWVPPEAQQPPGAICMFVKHLEGSMCKQTQASVTDMLISVAAAVNMTMAHTYRLYRLLM